MSTTLTTPSDGAMNVWVIYKNPSDFPGLFVVRRWESFYGIGNPIADPVCRTAETLEAARNLIPDGLVLVARSPEDDPAVLETWL